MYVQYCCPCTCVLINNCIILNMYFSGICTGSQSYSMYMSLQYYSTSKGEYIEIDTNNKVL